MAEEYGHSLRVPSPSLLHVGRDTDGHSGRSSRTGRRSFSGKSSRKGRSREFILDMGFGENEKFEPPDPAAHEVLQDGSKKWQSGDPYHHQIPKKGDPWEESFKMVQKFDDEMCRGWREEIDTLLVFAGLFSAAVTAFTVESYRWLQPDPDDITVLLLAQISAQLKSIGANTAILNETIATTATSASFVASPASVRVNIFWFTSLTLSLTAVLVGILCKQWLREYQRYEGLSPKEGFPVRQMRYEGLLGWHVPKILSLLPLLLQASLVLFFGGLLVLLWTINHTVASVITVLVGVAMLLLVSTTVLPFIQHFAHFSRFHPSKQPQRQCAFKSPQSRAFHLLGTSIVALFNQARLLFYGSTAVHYLQLPYCDSDANWVNYDIEWQSRGKYIERGISWFERTFSRNEDAVYNVYHCLETLNEDVAAGCVSAIIEDTWNPLVPLVGLLLPAFSMVQQQAQTGDDDMFVARDLVMSSYLVIHQKADMCFAQRCIEHCMRVINSSSDDVSSIVLEILNVVVPNVNLSDILLLQLTSSLGSLFQVDRIAESDISTFWSLFNHLRRYSLHDDNNIADPTASRPAYALLKEAEQWLSRLMDSDLPEQEKTDVAMNCSTGLCGIYWAARSHSELDSMKMLPEFDTVESIVQVIDRLMGSFGGPSSVLSPWKADAWEMAKVEFQRHPQRGNSVI